MKKLMKLLCAVGLHSWSEVTHRPCERFKICEVCGKDKIYPGYHRFGPWGDTHYVDVTYTYGGDPVQTIRESRQSRYCNDCKIYDERVLV